MMTDDNYFFRGLRAAVERWLTADDFGRRTHAYGDIETADNIPREAIQHVLAEVDALRTEVLTLRKALEGDEADAEYVSSATLAAEEISAVDGQAHRDQVTFKTTGNLLRTHTPKGRYRRGDTVRVYLVRDAQS